MAAAKQLPALAATGPITLQSQATPLREIEPGLLLKFEMDQAGGSHKVRAARRVVHQALAEGLIVPGVTTVIEKTGGNFGLGLALACREAEVSVELVIGLSFSEARRAHLRWLGVTLAGEDLLLQGATPRQVLEERLARADTLGRRYYYPDQFNNPACVEAHELDTGAEIVAQLHAHPAPRRVHLVACAGTGAHLTGIARAIRQAGFELHATLVEPAGCQSQTGLFIEHALEGMAVGVTPPLLDWSLVDEVVHVTAAETEATQKWLAQTRGFWVGRTSAACLAVARRSALGRTVGTAVLSLAYDQGAWYPARA